MGLVISDSSTLIHLAAIGRLSLLREFFANVAVPPAVWREVVEQGGVRAGVAEARQARQEGWIKVLPPGDVPLLKAAWGLRAWGQADDTLARAQEALAAGDYAQAMDGY